MAGHDICQGVGLASGSGIKGMSHIISMTHVTTDPSAGGRRVTRGCVFQERNTRGVATNVYLRKMSEKLEKMWSTNFK